MAYRCGHWGYGEMKEAFGWNLEDWIYFGGYPGAAPLKMDETAWRRYISDSLIETVLARDILQLTTVAKPALLRNLFGLSVSHPARILSYNKMLGQLQDAGNTTTLAHYLKLLETAFLVSGLDQYKAGRGHKRASSPKLVLWNNALVTAYVGGDYQATRRDLPWWGRLAENAVGAHLFTNSTTQPIGFTWRERMLRWVIKSPAIFGPLRKSGRGTPTVWRRSSSVIRTRGLS